MDWTDWFLLLFAGLLVFSGFWAILASIWGEEPVLGSRKVNAWIGAGVAIWGVSRMVDAIGVSTWSLAAAGVAVVLALTTLGYSVRRQSRGSAGCASKAGREVQP